MRQHAKQALLALCVLPLSGAATAHTGVHDAGGLAGGLLHPLAGVDHLAVMLAVGLWAAVALRRQAWKPVVIFPAFMLAGAALGMAGLALPALETGIAASVLVMGLLLVSCARVPAANGIALVALFALFHGNAHGLEMPAASAPLAYIAGFLLTTGLLHLGGLTLGHLFTRLKSEWLLRGTGVALGGTGAWLLLGS